ncbi:MAG: hypothetical protein PVI41_11370 [Roseobacter sp.]|jgi:hypothetical protein
MKTTLEGGASREQFRLRGAHVTGFALFQKSSGLRTHVAHRTNIQLNNARKDAPTIFDRQLVCAIVAAAPETLRYCRVKADTTSLHVSVIDGSKDRTEKILAAFVEQKCKYAD